MMMPSKSIAAAALAVTFAGGMALGWKIRAPKPVKPVGPLPGFTQPDGSHVLAVQPNPDAKPAQQVPKGAKVERVIQVTVQPSRPAVETLPTCGPGQSAAGSLLPATPCPPVRVDLTLIRMPDQVRRVVASSPDGRLIPGASMDIPVEQPSGPSIPKWTVTGLVGYDFRQHCRVYGAQASRSAGPFVVQTGWIGQTAFIGAGVRW